MQRHLLLELSVLVLQLSVDTLQFGSLASPLVLASRRVAGSENVEDVRWWRDRLSLLLLLLFLLVVTLLFHLFTAAFIFVKSWPPSIATFSTLVFALRRDLLRTFVVEIEPASIAGTLHLA